MLRAEGEGGSAGLVGSELERMRAKKIYPAMAKGLGAGTVIGAGMGLLSGAKTPRHLLVSALAGTIMAGLPIGLVSGSLAKNKVTLNYLRGKGFDITPGGRLQGMTAEAKKKYLSKKYVGGGHEKIKTIK